MMAVTNREGTYAEGYADAMRDAREDIRLAVIDERKRIIELINEHQAMCDSLDIIATAEWVKQELEGSDEEDS